MNGELVAALLIGLAGGAFGGLLGVGGGTLYVPALVLLLGVDQHTAQGVSLVVIIPTAISASVTNVRHGYVDATIARWVTPFALVAALGAAWLAGLIEGDVLSRIFGVVVVYVGSRTLWVTLRRPSQQPTPEATA